MPIIYFFGADGSGKTTLARLLCADFRKKGFKVKYSWMRGSHTLISVISRLLSRFSVFKGMSNPYYRIRVPNQMVRLWHLLEYVSSLPVILYRFVIPDLLGYTIVADRYALDLLVWVVLTTRDSSFLKTIPAKHLTSLALKTHFRFFIMADLDELVHRSGEETANLKRQLEIYESLNIDACRIDTTRKSSKESIREIENIICGIR